MSESEQLQKWPLAGTSRSVARSVLAALLVRASATLARLAAGLAVVPDRPGTEPRIEFHAEAGAPEGALYVDGMLVGWISGVSRL